MLNATSVPAPRSRRSLLAGALGGLVGLIAGRLGGPDPAAAVAGNPLIVGSTANDAGSAGTELKTNSAATALLVTQNGSGTALRGSAVGAGSIAGFFTAQNGTGISGVTGNPYRLRRVRPEQRQRWVGRGDPRQRGQQPRAGGHHQQPGKAAVRAVNTNTTVDDVAVTGLASSAADGDTHPAGARRSTRPPVSSPASTGSSALRSRPPRGAGVVGVSPGTAATGSMATRQRPPGPPTGSTAGPTARAGMAWPASTPVATACTAARAASAACMAPRARASACMASRPATSVCMATRTRQQLRGLFRRQPVRHFGQRRDQELPHRSSARSGQQGPDALLRRVQRAQAGLRRHGDHRRQGRGHVELPSLLRGPQQRPAVPADPDR